MRLVTVKTAKIGLYEISTTQQKANRVHISWDILHKCSVCLCLFACVCMCVHVLACVYVIMHRDKQKKLTSLEIY